MLNLYYFTFNPLQENTYVLFDDTRECVIFDPGCYEKHEQQRLHTYIASNGLNVVKIVNTHCHVDHVLGNHFCKETFKAPLLIPRLEEAPLRSVPLYAPMYGFNAYAPAEPDGYLEGREKLTFGNTSLDMLFVPGHSVGHLAFYCKEGSFCIAGDVLFNGSIGRTDLPGGNFDTLIHSIHTQLFTLPDDTTVYCGHGPYTKIGDEKRFNPFCAIKQ